MTDTYALIVESDMQIATIRVQNVNPADQKIGIHNIAEWLDSTEMGREEFVDGYSLWYTLGYEELNLVAMSLVGNRKVFRGPVVITTHTRRGIDTRGIPEDEIPMVWGWLEEIVSYNKLYMAAKGWSLTDLQQMVEEEIQGGSNDK